MDMYTIAEESVFCLIKNVPKLDLREELWAACEKYGRVLEVQKFKQEEFSESFLLKCKSVNQARLIKKGMHKKSFFGFELRIVYMPELESVDETLKKLKSRGKSAKAKTETLHLPLIRRRI